MLDPCSPLIDAALSLVDHLSQPDIELLAEELLRLDPQAPLEARAAVARVLPQQDDRMAANRALHDWIQVAPDLCPGELAALLIGAAAGGSRARDAQSLELAWSGPWPRDGTLRRTEQALLELIRGARVHLTVVAFTAYRVPELAAALEGAFRAGVRIRFVTESPDIEGGRNTFAPAGPGHALLGIAEVLEWPRELRGTDPSGNPALLHAKFATADDRILFVSSANLTEKAFNRNLELGVLIRGSALPGLARMQIDALVGEGQLRRLQTSRG